MITIVTPAYNAERFLALTIDSVAAQSFKDWEYIVVDDGSTDATAQIAEKWALSDGRIRVIRKENGGVSSARNRGFREANPASQYVIFLDADDLWETDTLETLLRAIEASPNAVAAYGLARSMDANGCLIDIGDLEAYQRERYAVAGRRLVKLAPNMPTTFAVEAVSESIVTSGTVLIRRDAAEKAGPWDEAIGMWEDWDFWLRLSRVGDMVLVDRHVLNYRHHDGNASGDTEKLEAGERHVRKRLLNSLAGTPDLLEIAVLGARFHQRRVISRRLEWAFAAIRKGDVIGCAKQLRQAVRATVQGPVKPDR